MFGPASDVKGQCNARLFLGDDFGDNTCTCQCGLEPIHDGPHREVTNRDYEGGAGIVIITWNHDERFKCEKHGPQPKDYCMECLADSVEDEPILEAVS